MSSFLFPGISSIGGMKSHLQFLLDNKEKQLQQVGTLGQRILSQQVLLDERVRELHKLEAELSDNQDLDSEIRERYRKLTEMVEVWDADNARLTQLFTPKPVTSGAPLQSSSRTSVIPQDSERSKVVSPTAAQSRRSRNAVHRADDVEFAFEIGAGLLSEVRRLQSSLEARDKTIQDMKEENHDLNMALKAQDQSTDKLKEENWNLEAALQELQAQLSDSRALIQRLEPDHKRSAKHLAPAPERSDQTGTENETLSMAFDECEWLLITDPASDGEELHES